MNNAARDMLVAISEFAQSGRGADVLSYKNEDNNDGLFSYTQTEDSDFIRGELQKIIMGKFATDALIKYADILKLIIPEIAPSIGFEQRTKYHDFDVWTHIAKSVGYAPFEPTLRFTMMFHDIGKPDCMTIDENGAGHFRGHGERGKVLAEGIMKRLNFPKEMFDKISLLILNHDYRIPEDEAGIRELIEMFGKEFLGELFMCEIADSMARKTNTETEMTISLRASLKIFKHIVDNT